MRTMMIVLESLDGVGKSTVGPALAKRLNGAYIATPCGEYNEHRKMANGNNVARFFYYLSAVVSACDAIRELLKKSVTVVVDRYIDSTVATHQALGVDATNLIDEEQLDIVRPDYVFFLDLDNVERRRRLTSRPMSEYDKRLESDEALQLKTREFFLARKLTVLNVTSLSVAEEVDQIVAEISRMEAAHANRG